MAIATPIVFLKTFRQGNLLMNGRVLKWSIWQLVAVAVAAPALAHHSAAGYDLTQIYSAQATIKEFRWGAPHSSGVFVVKGKDGKDQELTIATATPGALIKRGFKVKDFKVGEKVEIAWHPELDASLVPEPQD
jgi:hypothetical protein